MTTNELRTAVRDKAVDELLNIEGLLVLDDAPYTFILPVEIDGVAYHAQIGVTSKTVATTEKVTKYTPTNCHLASEVIPHLREMLKQVKKA